MNIIEKDNILGVERNGVIFINTTPHAINFTDGEIPVSGVLINATTKVEVVKENNGIVFQTTNFVASEEGQNSINRIKKLFGDDTIIIGSIIAAQAFPKQVVGMVPAKGFERVPPSEKKMDIHRFNIFIF